jgi:hypothetical protein
MNRLKEEIKLLLEQTEDEAVLEAVYALLHAPAGWGNEFTEEDIADLERALEAAEADVAAGRIVSRQEAKTRIDKIFETILENKT